MKKAENDFSFEGFRSDKNVLVTGGAGYIGSHVCKALASSGLTPVVFDNLGRGHEGAVKWGPLVKGDLEDRGALEDALTRYKPLAVVHLAGFTYVGESVEKPLLYYRNNVGGSFNLLETMIDHGIKKIVFSSSAAVYGTPSTIPIPEDHPLAPINPYGFSKMAIERVLLEEERAHGVRSVSLRYFNAAGADPDGETGEDHDPETHLIPLVLAAARGEAPPLTIYGTDYDTPDGTCLRDYIHVTDLAEAHVLALKKLMDGGETCALNLGTGSGFSVREIVRTAETVTGQSIPVRVGNRRPGDPSSLVSDPSLALHTLGWKPRHSDIGTIVETAWRWMNSR